jgi:hypothetical protein
LLTVAVIGSFNSRPEAELAAGMLGNDGIPATVVGDDAGGAAGVNLAAGGYRLEVPDDQCAEAEALLEPVVADDEPRKTELDRPSRPLALQVAVFLILAIVVIGVLSSVLD